MIERIRYIVARETLPYANLALEECLLETVVPGECILYLWQNRRTVVIGRNQNAWKECKTGELEADEGYLVRRLSGGGAVFHDLGNLNFTFLVNESDYDVGRQLDVIVEAVKKLGIDAEKTGRNDITADGKKFSGNAFYQSGRRCYHHGTILVNVDMASLSKYLNVSQDKLKSKGVESVRARVANLTQFRSEITIEMMKRSLLEAFEEVYHHDIIEIPYESLDIAHIEKLTEKYSAWDWNYGRKLKFETEISQRFAWGDIQLQLQLDEGRVKDLQVYSDAMDFEFSQKLPKDLKGILFTSRTLSDAVLSIPVNNKAAEMMRKDISDLIWQQDL